jgi:hypothetical protein
LTTEKLRGIAEAADDSGDRATTTIALPAIEDSINCPQMQRF